MRTTGLSFRVALALVLAGVASSALAQGTRERVRAYEAGVAPLRFTPPAPRQARLSNGVQVFLLEDHTLPQLSVTLVGRQGVANLPDSLWADGWQADQMLRTGGTTMLPPDSVDRLIDFYALNVFFATTNQTSIATVSGLSRHRNAMLDLLFDILRNPRNDTARIREVVGQVEEQWRRRNDQPFSIVSRAWAQLIMGDHPFARTLATPQEAAAFSPERFRRVQAMLYCPDRFVLGVVGDFDERSMLQMLERLFAGWGRCPAGTREIPPLHFAEGPRVVHIEGDFNQSNIRIGHGGGLRVGDNPDYFAARVADFLLGGGGGFSSRLYQRVRSDSGFAYSVFSNWGAEVRREGAFMVGGETRAEKTVSAMALMRSVVGSLLSQPVTPEDVRLAQDNQVNSFVFRFETPAQIVGQQVQYVVDSLPPNWFDVYLRGIQAVTADQVTRVATQYLHPDRMVMLVVGRSRTFEQPLSTLGPVSSMTLDQIVR